jgi:hypothetical protein
VLVILLFVLALLGRWDLDFSALRFLKWLQRPPYMGAVFYRAGR